ncbi:hypothetical protein E2C01_078158 [Portunus trituberculatus]|uniref:Uncharacterized protein n=1 Tax=Portunus trituberculatus TaxID=210409 RepID=A0A5B7IPF0_PORTR|nr:hypothetical protein [Portunus trituberculatus]
MAVNAGRGCGDLLPRDSLLLCPQFVMVLPLLTFALKLPLLVPCVDSMLQSIRQGYDRTHSRTNNN